MNVPVIKAHNDQRLVIDFIKNEQGQDAIAFTFEPDFSKPETPAQFAATNVANHIINQFALNRDEGQNATSTDIQQ